MFASLRVVHRFVAMLTTLLMYASAAQLAQNPSPMKDTTRDHTRVEEQQVPGRRLTVSLGTLMLPLEGKPTMLIVHFHSLPWLVEYAAQKRFPSAAVLTMNLNGASDVYREPFVDVTRFGKLIDEAEAAAKCSFHTIVLSSFSAGYGAIREILREKSNWPRISSVILADSLYADYGHEADDLGPFLAYIQGGKRLIMTHSELYPGTYEATFEAADWLLSKVGAKRKAILKWGPVGMQQLSETSRGGFIVLGFAGNTADDHVDHLFGLDQWYALALPPPPSPPRPARPKPTATRPTKK